MRIRLVRNLTVPEIVGRMKRYNSRYGMTFEEFERRFHAGKIGAALYGVYEEWAGLVDAYRGYQENGDVDYVAEEILELSNREFEDAITHRRMELLTTLASERVRSINELSRKLKRNVKNVYYDVKGLERLGVVRLRKTGRRNFVPEVVTREISILIP